MSIRIEIVGAERVLAGFAHVAEGMTRLAPLFERYGEEFYREEVSLFAAAPWTPLSEGYQERKSVAFPDKPILRATDRLFKSLTEQDAEGNIHRVSDQGAEFGSSVFYGIIHHEGIAPQPERRLLAELQMEKYDSLAAEYMMEIAEAAGFA